MNKYGGVDNQKTIDEIQEAEIVAAPIFHKIQPKSRAAVIGGWLVYWFISWLIIFPLLVAIGLTEQLQRLNVPWWLIFLVIPSVPFMLTLLLSLLHPKNSIKEDAGD